MEGSVRTQVFKKNLQDTSSALDGQHQQFLLNEQRETQARELRLSSSNEDVSLCCWGEIYRNSFSSLIPYHPISFPWKKRSDGEGGPQVLLSSGRNHPKPTPLLSPHGALRWWSLPTVGHHGAEVMRCRTRGGHHQKDLTKSRRGKAFFTYLSDKGVGANLLLNFHSSVLWWSASKV